MANYLDPIDAAIYTALGGDSADPPVFYALAPQGTPAPYIIYQLQDGVDERTFTDAGFMAEYMVKAVSRDLWPTEARSVYAEAHEALEGTQLTVDGFNALRCERRNVFEFPDGESFWNVGGVYRIQVWST